jgi:hypothetical protein
MRLLDRIFNRTKSVEPNATEMTFETAIRIIEDYGVVLRSATHAPGCVVDARNLPHPKQRIKEALIVALRSTTDPHKRDHCKTGLIYLADWQEGVGDTPVGFDPAKSGFDQAKLDRTALTPEFLEQLSSQLAGWEKWDPVVAAERKAVVLELKKLGLW